MKTVLINFELFSHDESEHYDLIMQQIPDCDAVIGLLLADGLLYKKKPFFDMYQRLKDSHPTKQFYLVAGMVGDDRTINFDFNLNETYNSYKQTTTYPWNPYSKKFLFLGGVPNRPNRILLLEKFYKKNMLAHAEWSFFKPWTEEQSTWCRTALQHYNDSEYEDFLNTCERSIDSVYLNSKEYGTSSDKKTYDWCKDPAWIDPNIYNSTVLSVVSEGLPYNNDVSTRFMTEKMWRVFVQQHPFVLAGTNDMMDYIKSLGFKTFEQYMRVPNYVEDLDAVVENTKGFLEDYPKHIDKIKADCEYNYELFVNLAQKNLIQLSWMQQYFKIKQQDINHWFGQKGFAHLL